MCDVPPTPAPSGPHTSGVTALRAVRDVRDVPKYDSAQPLAFLELIEKLLVSASGTTQSPSGVSGREWASFRPDYFGSE